MRSFAALFDYRCPFARIAHEHLLVGLAEGADWDVRFQPFSLSAAKDPTWDRAQDSGLLALELAVAVRDTQPERFLDAHGALFSFRHDRGGNLRDVEALRAVLDDVGVDTTALLEEVETGVPLKTVREEHTSATNDHSVWGVPAFIADDQAAFVRLMERPGVATVSGAAAIDRILDLLTGWSDLNEFKHMALPR